MSVSAAQAEVFYYEVIDGEPAFTVFDADGLPDLKRDGLGVGLRWSGKRATGRDPPPDDVLSNLQARVR